MTEYRGYTIRCEPGGGLMRIKAVIRRGRRYVDHVIGRSSEDATEKARRRIDELLSEEE